MEHFRFTANRLLLIQTNSRQNMQYVISIPGSATNGPAGFYIRHHALIDPHKYRLITLHWPQGSCSSSCSSGSSSARAKSGVLHCSNNYICVTGHRRPSYIVGPCSSLKKIWKQFVQEGIKRRDRGSKIKRKRIVGWSEGEDRRHVRGFHFLRLAVHPLTQNKVSSGKAKVLRETTLNCEVNQGRLW